MNANRISRTLVAGATIALLTLLVGCQGGASANPATGPVGLTQPPAGFDPNSPKVTAMNIAFDRTEFSVAANLPFVLVFENRESPPHNISIYRDAGYKDLVVEGVTFEGPATRWYPVPALPAGTYWFRCVVHPIPAMEGQLKAI